MTCGDCPALSGAGKNGEPCSIDPAVNELLKKAAQEQVPTAWDRYEQQRPLCGFGELGVCCRNCLQGPCRINPFGEPQAGVCGADADLIVSRNRLRMVTGGSASHTDHAYSAVQCLRLITEGKAGYELKGRDKIASVAAKLGIAAEGKEDRELAREIALAALQDFGSFTEEPMRWLTASAPAERVEVWKKLGVLPRNPDREIRTAMHRTAMGVDGSPLNLLLGAVKSGLIDGYAGLQMGTDIQDIIFGVPKPVKSAANLGVLEQNKVNVIVHGHMPEVSDKVVEWAEKMRGDAEAAGAEGINVAGICCSGNEVLMRRGVPSAGNFLSQELAVVTGAADAMVVDVQCFMPSLPKVAACYHTKIITTQGIAQLPEAEHIPVTPENADAQARRIIGLAIEAYKKRDPRRVRIPLHKTEAWGGFSVEAIVGALAKVDPANPLKPLVDSIAKGAIKGAVGVVGCNNVKVTQDAFHVELIKDLLAQDVLVVATGCSAQALAKYGFLNPEGAKQYAGPGLLPVLAAAGEAAGLGGPLPPVLHMGSCVDNSRIGDLLSALAGYLNVSTKDLPAAASAPELQHEKAVSIGVWAVALGLLTHISLAPPVLGSPLVTKILTQDIEGLTGGRFYVEADPHKAAQGILAHIMQKRRGLGI